MIVTIFVQSENASSERRFDKGIKIPDLKAKLEPITGIPADSQVLQLYNGDTLVASVEGDDHMLGAYPIDNYMTLKVTDSSPNVGAHRYNDLSQVEKYELPDEEYAKRTDSVLAHKRLNKFGRFAEVKEKSSTPEHTYEEEAKKIKVGDRCTVDFSEGNEESLMRRGTVEYVGETKFKSGYWIGVQYDEPLGKNDGEVQGVRYFTCRAKHGAFVRPNKVVVGDFPEEEIDEL